MMKKLLCALLAVLMLMPVLGTAMAAALPTVSFSAQSGAINGGFDYELKLKVSIAPAEDLPVTIKNNQTGETFTATIPAGAKQASCKVAMPEVSARQTVTFAIEKSDAYKAGAKHQVTVHPLPRVQFSSKVNMGAQGRKMSVTVSCANRASILKGNNTFQLRGTDGTVLAEKVWPVGSAETRFSFEVTQEMLGRQDMTVWLGDKQVSAEAGYGSLANTSRKIVQELAPQVPAMAIGIDCAYDDSKTDAILEVLEKHNVKVTFFMTGFFLREFPEAAKKIRDAGHEIANHSNTHEHMEEMGAYTQYRQVMKPAEDIEAMLGVTPRLFRPPFGEFNAQITSLCRGEGMEVIMWTMSYCDSMPVYPYEKMIKLATTGAEYGPGSIVLCHLDGHWMPDTLEAGLTYYESLGLQVMPISALIYASGGKLPPMPAAREPLVYSDAYWPEWLRTNVPEFAWVLEQ